MKELIEIQSELKVVKKNSGHGNQYKYRKAEEILEAVKPIAKKLGVLLIVSDEVVTKGDFNYIKSTATVIKDDIRISCEGWAKEPDELMSMSAPQITGSCSSYARKTALCGLFALDDNPDPDHGSNGGSDNFKEATPEQYQEIINLKKGLNPQQLQWVDNAVSGGLSFDEANKVISNIKGGN